MPKALSRFPPGLRNRSGGRARLVSAIAGGRGWLDEFVSASVTDIKQIATRQKCSVRQVNMTISLAFLAPDLVRAAVEGRLPRGIGVERLRDAPAEWSQQLEALGLNPQMRSSIVRCIFRRNGPTIQIAWKPHTCPPMPALRPNQSLRRG